MCQLSNLLQNGCNGSLFTSLASVLNQGLKGVCSYLEAWAVYIRVGHTAGDVGGSIKSGHIAIASPHV
jgi:hypothetical protein